MCSDKYLFLEERAESYAGWYEMHDLDLLQVIGAFDCNETSKESIRGA